MGRIGTTTLALAFFSSIAAPVVAQTSGARAITIRFTPTARAQIAVWIEKPDGTFLANVALTQAVSVRGIGNRPGATQMNSGFHWPYGRREGVLPIWAHRRAAAPNVPGQFPRVIFQNRHEGHASRDCEDSTPDTYFCLPFSGNTQKSGLDAVSCASPFNSDKGRIVTADDVKAGYAEPAELGGQGVMYPLSLTSLYPPRRDVTACNFDGYPGKPLHATCSVTSSDVRACHDTPDVNTYADNEGAVHLGYVDLTRAAMPDIDAVTMATPAGEQEANVMFTIPDDWLEGDYVALLEINTEGDYNGTFNDSTFPTPTTPGDGAWDQWALGSGYAYRGQPSVVYAVPFTLGEASSFGARDPAGYGSVDGLESDSSTMHAMDTTITDDPMNSPGSGADRVRLFPGETTRVQVVVPDCKDHTPPEAPAGFAAVPSDDPKHAHEWGHLEFTVPVSQMKIARYDVRFSKSPIVEGDATSFIQAFPALAANTSGEALMVPTSGSAGTKLSVDFGGLSASTSYWIAVRAVDVCNQPGPHVVGTLTTTKRSFTQLSGCFIATAAWGSELAPEVAALRRVRDELRPASALFSAATELYYRAGPAAAAVIARSDAARAIARRLVGPLGAIALVHDGM